MFALVNVTECSTMCDCDQALEELDARFAEEVVNADADAEPPATSAANDAKSAATAALIAMESPVVTCDLAV